MHLLVASSPLTTSSGKGRIPTRPAICRLKVQPRTSLCFKGKTYTIGRVNSEKVWKDILTKNGLRYDVDKDPDTNWIGTMGPYLNMLGYWGVKAAGTKSRP